MASSNNTKKNALISGNGGDEKNLQLGGSRLFFKSIFRRYSLFFFTCLFVFLKLKIYILIHIRVCGRVSDKTVFTRPISGSHTTFFGLNTVPFKFSRINHRLLAIMDGYNKCCEKNTGLLTKWTASSLLQNNDSTIEEIDGWNCCR